MTFKQWYESIARNCLVLYQEDDGHYRAKLDREGWFSGQWFDVPDYVQLTPQDEESFTGLGYGRNPRMEATK